MKDGYQIFLLIQLAQLIGIIPQELEYDLIWDKGTILYDEFQSSSFNDICEPEYECIYKFLESKKIIQK
jgi:hypothetical protein